MEQETITMRVTKEEVNFSPQSGTTTSLTPTGIRSCSGTLNSCSTTCSDNLIRKKASPPQKKGEGLKTTTTT